MISMKVVFIVAVEIDIVMSSCCGISAKCADCGVVWRDKMSVFNEIWIRGVFQFSVQGFFEVQGNIHCFVAATISTA